MTAPTTARPKTLCSSVTHELGRRIVSGTYAPLEVLPTEVALCAMLGVSRTTLREAIKRLHGKGLVDGGPRSGTHVLPTAHWNQLDGEVLAWRVEQGIDPTLLDHLFELRSCFEPRACRLAAERGTPAQHAAITDAFAALADPRRGAEDRVAADLRFHSNIFEATQNPLFIALSSAIAAALELSFRACQTPEPMDAMELALHQHIAQAIGAGDGATAETLMRELLEAARVSVEGRLRATAPRMQPAQT